jgi:hypothetical protein
MKLRPKVPHLQFNLLLADPRPAELPTYKNEELVHALVELLLSATIRNRLVGNSSSR